MPASAISMHSLRQINMTGKSLLIFRNRVKPGNQKYSASVLTPNQSHNFARLTADEGRWPSSRTRGEMRWTRELRLTCAAGAYGEVVWFGRRGAGAKLRGKNSAGDGGKRAVLRGEHEVSRKAIAQGRPECSRCPVCSCAVLFAQIARETAGAASTRSSLRPLISKRANEDANLGRNAPRERELTFSCRHPPCAQLRTGAGDPVFQRHQMIEPIGRGVLDRPVKPDDDSES